MAVRYRALALFACFAAACTGLADDLHRAEFAFTEARYEDVEVWLDALKPDIARMKPTERAQYYYFAGMSAYRIGVRTRARHALALCREELALSNMTLSPNYMRNLHAALEDLTGAD